MHLKMSSSVKWRPFCWGGGGGGGLTYRALRKQSVLLVMAYRPFTPSRIIRPTAKFIDNRTQRHKKLQYIFFSKCNFLSRKCFWIHRRQNANFFFRICYVNTISFGTIWPLTWPFWHHMSSNSAIINGFNMGQPATCTTRPYACKLAWHCSHWGPDEMTVILLLVAF